MLEIKTCQITLSLCWINSSQHGNFNDRGGNGSQNVTGAQNMGYNMA